MIRKASVLLALCLLLGLAARADAPRVILYSAYQQEGWGDRVEVFWVDRSGGLWTLSGSASSLKWPSDPEAQAKYLNETNAAVQTGALSSDDALALASLAWSVEDHGRQMGAGTMLDYGVSANFAVRYDGDGVPACVLLSAYGARAFSNPDDDALALNFALAKLTAQGISDEELMRALGINPVSLPEFCGYDPAALYGATLTAQYMDCEEGPIPVELDDAEEQRIRNLALNGSVVMKANALEVTGGSTDYIFRDQNGEVVAVISLYDGLLFTGDGMYVIK